MILHPHSILPPQRYAPFAGPACELVADGGGALSVGLPRRGSRGGLGEAALSAKLVFPFRSSGFGVRASELTTRRAGSAFTLIEVLLALAISAIVLAGIGGVFFSAMRLRERTTAALGEAAPLHQALTFLRRDLQGALPPGAMLAGDFKYGALDNSVGQGFGLQFTTTTAVIREEVPWGDVQEVTYELRDPVVRSNGVMGKELFRLVTRNLLTTTTLEADEQFLLGNIEQFEVSCFDGLEWRETWDTSLTDTNLPAAVRVRLQLVSETLADQRSRQPLELIVPLVVQARTTTNETDAATEEPEG